jgi:uncharacterized protein (DUF885 family)
MSTIYKLSKEFVYDYVKLCPTIGTIIGIHDFDSEWDNFSVKQIYNTIELIQFYMQKLKEIKPQIKQTKKHHHKLAYDVFLEYLTSILKYIKYNVYYYDLNSNHCSFHIIISVFDLMKKDTETDIHNIISRLINIDIVFEQYISKLRIAIKKGYVVAKRQVLSVIDQVTELTKMECNDLIKSIPEKYQNTCTNLIAHKMIPALEKFKEFLQMEYLSKATNRDSVGKKLYKYYVKSFIKSDINLIDTYNWGFEEINRVYNQIKQLAKEIDPQSIDPLQLKNKLESLDCVQNINEFIEQIKIIESQAMTQLADYANN